MRSRSDLGEEALDHVEPGGRRRGEVQMKTGMRREPALDGRGFMSGVVVDDQMKVEPGRGLPIDQREKTQELAVAVARHARADHFAVQHVHCRE